MLGWASNSAELVNEGRESVCLFQPWIAFDGTLLLCLPASLSLLAISLP
jgi:hypothetical protein